MLKPISPNSSASAKSGCATQQFLHFPQVLLPSTRIFSGNKHEVGLKNYNFLRSLSPQRLVALHSPRPSSFCHAAGEPPQKIGKNNIYIYISFLEEKHELGLKRYNFMRSPSPQRLVALHVSWPSRFCNAAGEPPQKNRKK